MGATFRPFIATVVLDYRIGVAQTRKREMSSIPPGDYGAGQSGFGDSSGYRSPFEDNPFADLTSTRKTPPVPGILHDPSAGIISLQSDLSNSIVLSRGLETSPGYFPQTTPGKSSPGNSAPKPSQTTSTQPSTTTVPKSSPIVSRRRPTGSRLGQSIVQRVEDLDLTSDPLGPLGETSTPQEISTPPPPPPPKDDPTASKQPPTTFAEIKSDISESGRPDFAQVPCATRQLNIPPEQAAQLPTFHITVGDPTTIGNITGSHTEYKVRTKTNSKAFKSEEFAVNRRYRDFLWLYNALNNNNPGIVVPPPPEKQQLGRFQDEFVEARRTALERMLNKIGLHPLLQRDIDFKLFIESDAFNVDVKQREKANSVLESKGFMGSINLSPFGGKMPESDEVRFLLNELRIVV
jgi:sorting nexin-1/2